MWWATVAGRVGRALIVVGVLLLLFVAYSLWGTGIQQARAQARLEGEFAEALAAVATTTTTAAPSSSTSSSTTSSTTTPTPTTTVPALPSFEAGDPIGRIRIPAIGVDEIVVQGVSVGDLKAGPGHYPITPMPGQVGNAAIAGHRTTYGQPFYNLNEVEEGDEIVVQTLQGVFTYVVDDTLIVLPHQTEVLNQTDEARLTLTTCEPRFSARKRLIVTGVLQEQPAPAPSTTVPADDGDDGGGDDGGGGGVVNEPDGQVVLDDPSLSGDPAARWPAFWWALLTAVIGAVIWWLARWLRPLWVYLAGAPVFLVVLFVFFENVSRLLPANI